MGNTKPILANVKDLQRPNVGPTGYVQTTHTNLFNSNITHYKGIMLVRFVMYKPPIRNVEAPSPPQLMAFKLSRQYNNWTWTYGKQTFTSLVNLNITHHKGKKISEHASAVVASPLLDGPRLPAQIVSAVPYPAGQSTTRRTPTSSTDRLGGVRSSRMTVLLLLSLSSCCCLACSSWYP